MPHDADPWESLAVRSCTWHGTTVDLDLSGDEDGSADATLEHARTLLATWDDWEDRLRALLARKLLPLWLDWHADGP